jgi:small-conductance mechanosensitive channel
MDKIGKYMIFRRALVFLVLFLGTNIYSQDTIDGSDSTGISDVEQLKSSLRESIRLADSLRTADSVRKIRIREMIRSESLSGDEERESLLKELAELKKRDSLSLLAGRSRIDSLKATGYGYSVMFQEDSLFTLFEGVGAYSAEERSKAISERISEIAVDENFTGRNFSVVPVSSNLARAYYSNKILFAVTSEDSYWESAPPDVLAQIYLDRVSDHVSEYNSSFSLISLALEILLALLVIATVIAAIKLVNRGTNKLTAKTASLEGTFFTGFSFRGYELVNGNRQVSILLAGLRLLRVAVLIFLFYISIPILLSVFPWTRGWADKLFGYVLDPLSEIGMALLNYIPNLITIAIVFFLVKSLVKFLKFITLEIEKENLNLPGFYPDWAKPTFNIVRILLYAYAFVVIFNYLPGSDSQVFKGVTVFLGVLFSLGSSSAIANMIAGVVITYMRPYRLGDRVKIGEVTGDVLQKTLLVTRIRTPKNEEITIPNSQILSNHTVNYTYFTKKNESPGLVLHSTITIGYDVPWRKVHEMLIEAAITTEGVSPDTKPFVLQTSLDDFYVSYQINCYTFESTATPRIYPELHSNIQDIFAREDIEIMSPHYRAERDGSQITIPPGFKPNESEDGNH